jgi:hypothetical protein
MCKQIGNDRLTCQPVLSSEFFRIAKRKQPSKKQKKNGIFWGASVNPVTNQGLKFPLSTFNTPVDPLYLLQFESVEKNVL